ncbi:MAG: SDR family oxidoreductase [Candidatus Acidiferrum sp.]
MPLDKRRYQLLQPTKWPTLAREPIQYCVASGVRLELGFRPGSIDIITRVLAKELGPKKIRVNSINPGGTDTEGAHALGVMGSEFEKHIISQTPLGRFGRPEDIAPVAVFLSSEASFWITGEIILASGGMR